jgi:hypothetical protein
VIAGGRQRRGVAPSCGLNYRELDLLFNPNAMLAGIDGSAYKWV